MGEEGNLFSSNRYILTCHKQFIISIFNYFIGYFILILCLFDL